MSKLGCHIGVQNERISPASKIAAVGSRGRSVSPRRWPPIPGARQRWGLILLLRRSAAPLPRRPIFQPRWPRRRGHRRRALRRPAIPFAISFLSPSPSASPPRPNLLDVADEDGCVGLYVSRRCLPSSSSSVEKSAETRVSDWVAHNSAIFDVCWIKEGSQILTLGDQTVKIRRVRNKKCIGVLSGHTGSMKSLSCHSSNPELIVSGLRDGSFALWDSRCDPKSPNSHGEACLMRHVPNRCFSMQVVKS